ncbi:MAG: hypothetical protein H6832_17305 [Planctomycetes bacterium]|nr:hypothetical protein [Planctomycetota bacterium]MCB9920162.1 hypothetical protein [Planctomycetota bacterium]
MDPVVRGLCPACERIRDRMPAGIVELSMVPSELREEIVHMIENLEQRERVEHPLERLMDIESSRDGELRITTTGMHLSRGIASALRRRFHQGVNIQYPDGDGPVRIAWRT